MACFSSQGQVGKYLNIWGGAQSTQINNSQESYYGGSSSDKVSPVETIKPIAGIDYIYNFHDLFGVQTGVIYSAQGQKYSGFVSHDANDTSGKIDSNVNFTSHVYMTYIKVPILLRFNSHKEEEDIANFSMYAGFEFAYLASVDEVVTTPAPPSYMTTNQVNFKKYYNSLDFGWCAGAQVNLYVSKHWGISVGARYTRSLMDVESKNIVYDKSKAYPAEWYYPLSVKKSSTPSQSDQYDRFSSKNNTVGFYIGLVIPL